MQIEEAKESSRRKEIEIQEALREREQMRLEMERMQRDLEGAYELKAQVDQLRAEGVLDVDINNRLVSS